MKGRRSFLHRILLSLMAIPNIIGAKEHNSISNSADMNKSTVFNTLGKPTSEEYFNKNSISVKDFGAIGNWDPIKSEGHDDTMAFQKAIDYAQKNQLSLRIPKARYGVSKIVFSGIYNYIICEGARIYGISKNKEESILSFYNARETTLKGLLIITSDGDKKDSKYHSNYECALRIHSSESSANKSQMMWFDSIMISNFKNGLVIGNNYGETAQSYQPQSEIWFTAFQTRGVLRPIYCNAKNSITYFDKSLILSQKGEVSSAWWDDEIGWCVRGDEGTMIFSNCELQRASSKGYCIYGKDIFFFSGIHEYSCSNYITGTVEIKNIVNGFFGSGGITPFIISDNTSGRLLLDGVRVRRSSKVSLKDYTSLIECHSSIYSLEIINCIFNEFSLDLVNGNGWFIRGGHLNIFNTKLENVTLDKMTVHLSNNSSIFSSIDPTGFCVREDMNIEESGWLIKHKIGNSSFGLSNSIMFKETKRSYVLSSHNGIISLISKPFTIKKNNFILELDVFYTTSNPKESQIIIAMKALDFRMTEISPQLTLLQKKAIELKSSDNQKIITLRIFGKTPSETSHAQISIETHNFDAFHFTNIKILQ